MIRRNDEVLEIACTQHMNTYQSRNDVVYRIVFH
jgi:hypothetical protein